MAGRSDFHTGGLDLKITRRRRLNWGAKFDNPKRDALMHSESGSVIHHLADVRITETPHENNNAA